MTKYTKRVPSTAWPPTWRSCYYESLNGGRVSFCLPDKEAEEMEAMLDAALKPTDSK